MISLKQHLKLDIKHFLGRESEHYRKSNTKNTTNITYTSTDR